MNDFRWRCESPIERRLARRLAAALPAPVVCEMQRKVVLRRVPDIRVDFHLQSLRYRSVVVECDGREFHEVVRDRRRDVCAIREAGIDAVVRFRGCDLVHDPDGCVRFLRAAVPDLFAKAEIPTAQELADFDFEHVSPILRCGVPGKQRVRVSSIRRGRFRVIARVNATRHAIVELVGPGFLRPYAGPRNQEITDCLADAYEAMEARR